MMNEVSYTMRLASVIDVSLVDVPGIPVTVIFTGGCNFDCPYCQNASLIPSTSGEDTPIEEIVDMVRGYLSDGFCITGGEPTIHKDLPDLLKALKEGIGGHINLNSQGSNPDVLRKSLPYLDSIWFDMKAAPTRYSVTCRTLEDPWPRIRESIDCILESDVAFWPRTTYVEGLLDLNDIREILTFLISIQFKGEYVIQNYVASTGVRESETTHISSPSIEHIQPILDESPSDIEIKLEWR
ncbi:MAG: anaerobic ribonucleoside-triphosphate reductase activating protein [Candidatus Thorarchaeota archaeon]|jgi:pyruvate formate lyase activating enzyme